MSQHASLTVPSHTHVSQRHDTRTATTLVYSCTAGTLGHARQVSRARFGRAVMAALALSSQRGIYLVLSGPLLHS